MNIIFSFDHRPIVQKKCSGWRSSEMMCLSILRAVRQAQKIGPVTFYTDKHTEKLLSMLNLGIKTEEVFGDEPVGPAEMFSLCKVKACEYQKEPFAHIDFDAFINDLAHTREAPIACAFPIDLSISSVYTNVPHMDKQGIVKTKIFDYTPDFSPAFGLYLCNDLGFNEEFVYEVFNFISANAEAFPKLTAAQRSLLNPISEEYVAGCVAKRRGLSFATLDPASPVFSWKNRYVHLFGGLKRQQENLYVLRKLVADDVSKAAAYWDSVVKGEQ